MSWTTRRQEERAARGHEVVCDGCGRSVASTMKRGPPRGWNADASRQVPEVVGPGFSVSRAARFCSRACAATPPKGGSATAKETAGGR